MTKTKMAATAILIALSLSACAGRGSLDEPNEPTSSSESAGTNSSESTTAPPKDRSDEVFSNYEQPEVLGSTSGTVNLGVGSHHRQFEEDVTFEVTGVTVASDVTILRYQLSADDGDAEFGMEGRFWYDQPALQVPGSDLQLQTVTATLPEQDNAEAQEICVCTSVRSAGEHPRPQTVVYESLPEDATTVDVILPGLDPVTVPVTR